MKPTVTTISTGYHTEEGEIVEFFYTEIGGGRGKVEFQSEYKINMDEISFMQSDFMNRVDEFLKEQDVKVNYEVVK